MTFKQLKTRLQNNEKIMWNDSDPVIGNDYLITDIYWDEESDENEDTPILIKYNNGNSEAEILINEIHRVI